MNSETLPKAGRRNGSPPEPVLSPEARRNLSAGALEDARRYMLTAARHLDAAGEREAHHHALLAVAHIDDARDELTKGGE